MMIILTINVRIVLLIDTYMLARVIYFWRVNGQVNVFFLCLHYPPGTTAVSRCFSPVVDFTSGMKKNVSINPPPLPIDTTRRP